MGIAQTQKEPCVACGSVTYNKLFDARSFDSKAESFGLLQCVSCKLVKIDPIPDPTQLARYYSIEYYGTSDKKFVSFLEVPVRLANQMRAGALCKFTSLPIPHMSPRVLDIGCGRGNFLKAMSVRGWDCYGIEIPTFKFPEPERDIHFLHGELKEQKFPDGFFNAVSIWHVLEHTRDPSSTIQEISRVLRPGGIAAIAVPNFGSIQSKIFKGHWFHLDLPRHLFHMDSQVLTKLLRDNQLEPVSIKTNSLEQNLYGFVQTALNWLFRRGQPNELFALLKKKNVNSRSFFSLSKLAGYGLISLVLMPFAILENMVSVCFGKGGMLMVYAKKQA